MACGQHADDGVRFDPLTLCEVIRMSLGQRLGRLVSVIAIVGIGFGSQASLASGELNFEGLERIYFNRAVVATDGPPKSGRFADVVAKALAEALPERLAQPETTVWRDRTEDDNFDFEYVVQDFPLPMLSVERPVWLRQVSGDPVYRIQSLWWALYDAGKRSEVWHFDPSSAYSAGCAYKDVANYRFVDLRASKGSEAVIRVLGEMYRPAGANWTLGQEWSFVLARDTLRLVRVRDAFGFWIGPDLGKGVGPVSVASEQLVGGRFEYRKVEDASPHSLEICASEVRENSEKLTSDKWTNLEKQALCLTRGDGAEVGHRALTASSRCERGGQVEQDIPPDAQKDARR